MSTTSNQLSRRDVLERMGTGAVAVAVSTACGDMSPREARAERMALRHFDDQEARALEALGDTLLPGAGEAGIAHFVDDQLGREDPMLLLRYLDYPGSFVEFYRQGLRSLNLLGAERFGKPFDAISEAQRTELVGEISAANPASWSGPPAPLFYFAARSDAVDVVYGTPEGLAELALPAMLHIAPPGRW